MALTKQLMKLDQVALLEKIAQLRIKWLKYHKAGDDLMCGIVERQAKIYKDSLEKLEKTDPDDNTAFAEELFTK